MFNTIIFLKKTKGQSEVSMPDHKDKSPINPCSIGCGLHHNF